ncbi:MAG: flagellar biosynthesis regulator FlaF [Micavibrio aeruginosavorus]|uniref:Flagellar biosynthesis regulator FlaF n=1 Tax=Micavibrio aeruginosavorus TaxID=349221 RepID=A0A7T5UG52_9BACT|nr:MAG: flagellar biosynthesis regulator FlaF [Micavibrio aeruginosavorus]
MSKGNPPNNPYASASRHYDTHAKNTTGDPRELEARVLIKSAKQLQDIQARWDSGMTGEELNEVLLYNRQIWMIFVDTALENTGEGHTIELRNNIANLGTFIFKQTIDILAAPKKEKLNILIEINREIAGGLMQQIPKTAEGAGTPSPAQPASGSRTSETA